MQTKNSVIKRLVAGFNAMMLSLRDSPRLGRSLRRHIAIVTYTGRRSGKTFSLPVGFRRSGDTVTIGVAAPDLKNWWKNFLDGPEPISLELNGEQRAGQATARRDAKNVTVTVVLEPA